MLKKSNIIITLASFILLSGNVYAEDFVPGKPSNWYNEFEHLIAYSVDPVTNNIKIQYVADKDRPCIKDNQGNVTVNWKIKEGPAAWSWMIKKGLIRRDNWGNYHPTEDHVTWQYMYERNLLYWQDLTDKQCLNTKNPKPTPPSQSNQFDPGWDGCPPRRPGNRNIVKYYPNNLKSGGTYLQCTYFNNGALNSKKNYVNGKLEGKTIVWNLRNGTHYVSKRENYVNNKLHGLKEEYVMSTSGAIFRQIMATYVNGKKHGNETLWWPNGNLQRESNYVQGNVTRSENYGKDGSFLYCTKYGNDGKARDCYTGKIR